MAIPFQSVLDQLTDYLPILEQPGRSFGVKKGKHLVEIPKDIRAFGKLLYELWFTTDLPDRDVRGLLYDRERLMAETDLPTLGVVLYLLIRTADRSDSPNSYFWLYESGHVQTVLRRIRHLRDQRGSEC